LERELPVDQRLDQRLVNSEILEKMGRMAAMEVTFMPSWVSAMDQMAGFVMAPIEFC